MTGTARRPLVLAVGSAQVDARLAQGAGEGGDDVGVNVARSVIEIDYGVPRIRRWADSNVANHVWLNPTPNVDQSKECRKQGRVSCIGLLQLCPACLEALS
jgi:hypothetical protein